MSKLPLDPLSGWGHAEPPFHAGERALQARYGLSERMDEVGRRVVRQAMPDQHRQFFAELPFLVVGSVSPERAPWASVLAGAPGFVQSPEPTTLLVSARPVSGDPLAQQLREGARLGLLGIQFDTRRRNRMNGDVTWADALGFRVQVAQSFGNCPKYIQRRRAEFAPVPDAQSQVTPEHSALSARARAIIGAADTFFIASCAPDADQVRDPAFGVDVSHRGGPAGFVACSAGPRGDVLTFPDFAGNYFFNTLGNLSLHPRAGLTFLDFARSSALMLTGSTELVLDGPEVAAIPGAQRLVRFQVERGVLLEAALPLRFSALEPGA